MRRKSTRALVALVCFKLLVASNFASNVLSETTARPSGRNVDEIAERVKRIEQGLLPAVLIKGQSHAAYKLTDRMSFYSTPGVSVAVINNGELEWAKGYGVLESGAAG